MLDSVISSKKFNNFEIIQNIKQQLFIKAPCLYHEPERARIFEMILCKRDAITSAKASPDVASVAIQFDSEKLSLENLFILLDSILANIGFKLTNTLQQLKAVTANSTQTEVVSSFLIKGMQCESCAVSLEMAVNRHPKIDRACVDYNSTLLEVQGAFSNQEIITLVADMGFESIVQ
jgi:copper chaperone CopZ